MPAGKASEKLRINPRKSWSNVEEATKGDYEVTLRLKRQAGAARTAGLPEGRRSIPHVAARDMRA